MTQTEHILRHLKDNGSITPLEALQEYGCMRLGARIYDLKHQGYNIRAEIVHDDGKHYARYTMGAGR